VEVISAELNGNGTVTTAVDVNRLQSHHRRTRRSSKEIGLASFKPSLSHKVVTSERQGSRSHLKGIHQEIMKCSSINACYPSRFRHIITTRSFPNIPPVSYSLLSFFRLEHNKSYIPLFAARFWSTATILGPDGGTMSYIMLLLGGLKHPKNIPLKVPACSVSAISQSQKWEIRRLGYCYLTEGWKTSKIVKTAEYPITS